MKIKGVGKTKTEIIIAYCGSIENAAKNGSLLHRCKLPLIGVKKSLEIFNILNK